MKSFSELTRKEKNIELLRWVCVLPMAMLASLVGQMLTVVLVVHPILSGLSREGSGRWLRHLIGDFLGGAAFVVGWTPSSVRFQLEIARTRASKLRLSTGCLEEGGIRLRFSGIALISG